MDTQMLISQAPSIPRLQAAAQAIKVPELKNACGDSAADADLSVWHKLYRPCSCDAHFMGVKTAAIFEP
ncbi:hypothetical protein [Gloeobacter morelensis]|uniref:Uncharacterized protein n=1 Tax=Gloeobacter morelensis MG652769 TaxID=2781736 RepID=A0ABY3PM88_9CYAN|nr:hypothetical protein [Gloeobacter morelensis]UFP94798.1 hypothetical protein ISF26_00650 [Gloeobacter morelensis MG652769]